MGLSMRHWRAEAGSRSRRRIAVVALYLLLDWCCHRFDVAVGLELLLLGGAMPRWVSSVLVEKVERDCAVAVPLTVVVIPSVLSMAVLNCASIAIMLLLGCNYRCWRHSRRCSLSLTLDGRRMLLNLVASVAQNKYME